MAAIDRLGVAVIGCGYWGINHVRTLAAEPSAALRWVCDSAEPARQRALARAPGARAATDIDEVLGDDVEAVVIATPAVTHAALAERALRAGKHVLVEKPVALSVADAARVRDVAAAEGRILAVGHLMLYHPAVELLGELIRSGELGELYYLYAARVNLGRVRRDENALWSFGPHDLSMIDYFLGETPVSVTARGQSYLQGNVEDVVFVTLRFAGGQMAHVHLSWLDPRKERRLTVVCSKKMVEFDDVASEKLRIYDKGYDRPPEFTEFGEYLTIRHGDIHIPHVAMAEPLAVEIRHFLECARTGERPRTDGDSALRVVQVLEAAEKSLAADGAPVEIDPSPKAHRNRGPLVGAIEPR
jgi:predicted dehydrogenase